MNERMTALPMGWTVAVAAATAAPMGIGPVVRLAGRWTTIDRWWRRWCALTCALWSAGIAVVAALSGVSAPMTVAVAVLGAAAATVLSVVDLREGRLPHPLTAVVGSGAITIGVAAGDARAAVFGAAAAYAVHIAIRGFAAGAVGGGDVQLSVAVGALAGPAGPVGWALAFLIAALSTAALSTASLSTASLSTGARSGAALLDGVGRAAVPHGPSLCVAGMLAPAWS